MFVNFFGYGPSQKNWTSARFPSCVFRWNRWIPLNSCASTLPMNACSRCGETLEGSGDWRTVWCNYEIRVEVWNYGSLCYTYSQNIDLTSRKKHGHLASKTTNASRNRNINHLLITLESADANKWSKRGFSNVQTKEGVLDINGLKRWSHPRVVTPKSPTRCRISHQKLRDWKYQSWCLRKGFLAKPNRSRHVGQVWGTLTSPTPVPCVASSMCSSRRLIFPTPSIYRAPATSEVKSSENDSPRNEE